MITLYFDCSTKVTYANGAFALPAWINKNLMVGGQTTQPYWINFGDYDGYFFPFKFSNNIFKLENKVALTKLHAIPRLPVLFGTMKAGRTVRLYYSESTKNLAGEHTLILAKLNNGNFGFVIVRKKT